MATPSGQIGFSDVNLELGVSPTSTQANLGSAPFRGLAGVPSGQISMSNLQNKSSFTGITATGGTIIDSGGYRIHVFTSPGSFAVSNLGDEGTIEYLLVAGGGSGGNSFSQTSGGGGAGGFRNAAGFPVSVTTYPITIGAGGGPSANGGFTYFGPIPTNLIRASGGGRGNLYPSPGAPGGSGGGGGNGDPNAGSGNIGGYSPPEGNPGGTGIPRGGGGGGAGEPGYPSSTPGANRGRGGNGLPISWLPASYGTPGPAPGRYFAGGGGGGDSELGPNPGGVGGGGAGGKGTSGLPGTTNTGGGGGGGFDTSTTGNGGSGIVAIRYPI